MRTLRFKPDWQNTWHHCYNHAVGTVSDRPFGNAEKDQFIRILKRVSGLYTIRVASFTVMSNHYHLLLQAPVEEPTAAETAARYAAFYHGRRTLAVASPRCRVWQQRLRDVSWFIRHLQQLFARWFNKTRPEHRQGGLWSDRFKNTVLEDGAAAWNGWLYIERNAVRVGLTSTAGAYRYGAFGAWQAIGEHPFAEALEQIVASGALGLTTVAAIKAALDRELEVAPPDPATLQRVKHWVAGRVVGSARFLKEVLAHGGAGVAHAWTRPCSLGATALFCLNPRSAVVA